MLYIYIYINSESPSCAAALALAFNRCQLRGISFSAGAFTKYMSEVFLSY